MVHRLAEILAHPLMLGFELRNGVTKLFSGFELGHGVTELFSGFELGHGVSKLFFGRGGHSLSSCSGMTFPYSFSIAARIKRSVCV